MENNYRPAVGLSAVSGMSDSQKYHPYGSVRGCYVIPAAEQYGNSLCVGECPAVSSESKKGTTAKSGAC